MASSPLFYGYYEGTYTFEFNSGPYQFPLAYFLVYFAIFVINMCAVIASFAKAFRTEATETNELSQAPTSELIFSSWDYSIKDLHMAAIIMLKIKGRLFHER